MLDIKTMNPRSNKKLGLHFPIPPSSPKATTQFYANFINGGQSLYAPINGTSGVTTIPATLKGITYIIVVNSPNVTSDATTIAGPGIAILE